MIQFTTRYDPETDLWQFLVHKGEERIWSRPMSHTDMARIARDQYQKRLSEGRGSQQAKTFYASGISIGDLLASGAFAVTKVPTTSPELLAIARRKERQELRAMPLDDLMAQLGLDNPVIPGA
jgi:hypothetical protein